MKEIYFNDAAHVDLGVKPSDFDGATSTGARIDIKLFTNSVNEFYAAFRHVAAPGAVTATNLASSGDNDKLVVELHDHNLQPGRLRALLTITGVESDGAKHTSTRLIDPGISLVSGLKDILSSVAQATSSASAGEIILTLGEEHYSVDPHYQSKVAIPVSKAPFIPSEHQDNNYYYASASSLYGEFDVDA